MAEVRVRRTKEVNVTGEKTKREEKDYTVYAEKIGEDGGAMVSRSRSIQQGASLEFGEYKISVSDTATVSVHCKQTPKHIKLANRICRQFRDTFLEEDFKESGLLVRRLMKSAAKTRRPKS